jgi:hypothetical protein
MAWVLPEQAILVSSLLLFFPGNRTDMTAKLLTTVAEACQSLQENLDGHLFLGSSGEAVPAVGAALRQAIAAHLPEGWAMVRGYLRLADQPSLLLEGMLIDLQAELFFHSPDLVIAPPEAVYGLWQVLPPAPQEALAQLSGVAASWRSAVNRPQLPVIGTLAQTSANGEELLELLAAQSEQQPARCLDRLVLSPEQHIAFRPDTQCYHLSQWRGAQDQASSKALPLAFALGAFLQPLLGADLATLSFNEAQPQDISQRGLDQRPLANPEAPGQSFPPPMAAHDQPGQGAQATAPASHPPSPPSLPQPHLTAEKLQAMHTPDQQGYFPLHHAVLDQASQRLQNLIQQGAVTEVKDREGNTPLHLTVQNGHLAMAKLLLEHGADPNHPNYEAMTPLHLAVEQQQASLTHLLLAHQSDLEARNLQDQTPLHLAASKGCYRCAEVLLQAGADLEATTGKDLRPLHLAAWYGHSEMARLLIELGADPNAVNGDGNSPLHFAAFNGQVKLIKLLINHRADPAILNYTGETYLQGINAGYRGELMSRLE